jgi:transposase
MPGPSATAVRIPAHLRPKLRKLARSHTAPHRLVQRARIVRAAAAGWENQRIADRVGCSVRTVRRWRDRFAADPSMRALKDLQRSGRPPEVPLEVRARLVSLACERVDNDKTPFRVLWSQKALQAALLEETGFLISVSEVGRILRNGAIRPHRVRMWLNSQDPRFAEKARRVCQHYVDPEDGVTVLCVDEKRLFAHDHAPGIRPPAPRHPESRREFQYSRNGSSTLLAAFNTATGEVYGECRERRTASDLVAFMEELARRTPGRVVIIWDNLNIHHEGKDKRWSAFNQRQGGRFSFVHTPTHASWLNQVECWFSILERRVLRHASFRSVAELNARVEGFVSHWNEHEAHPFNWTFRGHFASGHDGEHDERVRARSNGRRVAA